MFHGMAEVNIRHSVIVNELLCFLQNSISNVPKLNLINVGSSFYTSYEIVNAKAELYAYAEGLCDELPRCKQRRPSDNKKLDLDDIYSLWMHLDVNKVELPLCTAANLKRVPPVSPSEADICTFASNVSSLQQKVVALSTLKETVTVTVQLNEKIKIVHEAVCERKPTHLGRADDNVNSQVIDDMTPECSTASDKSSYAGVAVADDVTDFIMQTNRKKREVCSNSQWPSSNRSSLVTVTKRTLQGKADNVAISGVPRRLVAYNSQ